MFTAKTHKVNVNQKKIQNVTFYHYIPMMTTTFLIHKF